MENIIVKIANKFNMDKKEEQIKLIEEYIKYINKGYIIKIDITSRDEQLTAMRIITMICSQIDITVHAMASRYELSISLFIKKGE